MELLEKFAAVEIKTDNRISEQDRQYCVAHQAAYEAALSGYRELAFFVADMKNAQNELLGRWKDRERFHDYLYSPDGPDLSQDAIEAHIQYLHKDHIEMLVRYFKETYCIDLDSGDICKAVLADGLEVMIRYQSVIEQIILRLNGRSFSEQAICELRERCHKAAWNVTKQIPKFEVAKGTIRFWGNFCIYDCGVCERWKLSEDMQEILRGATHFETGAFHPSPSGFSELLDGKSLTVDFVDWPGGEKVKGLKMFKNGRVDLKFTSVEFSQKFVRKYLGSLY